MKRSLLLLTIAMLASTALSEDQTTLTLKFHKFILPYLMDTTTATDFVTTAFGLGITSQDFTTNTTTGDITFSVGPDVVTAAEQKICTDKTATSGLMCYLESISDAEGNTLCGGLNLCGITIEPTTVPVTFEFHKFILPYLMDENNQLPFIVAAYGLGVDSKLFSPNTTTGDVTFYVSATAATNINNNICTEKKTTSGYLCYLKSIKDASGNTLCGDLNLCDMTIEPTNVPVTFEFHKFILPYLMDTNNQLPFIMAAYGLGVDSKTFVPDTTTGDVTFYVSATAADAINNNICTEKKTTSSYLCYLKSIKDASGNTLCGDLNLCGKPIEPTNVPVTFSFHKFILPYLMDTNNQLPFIMAAYGLGVDSKLFSPNTTTGDVTFYVSATAADAINNNICTEKKETSGYLCYLKSIKDASGNTLCEGLNLCDMTIEPTNVPVTFSFHKYILPYLMDTNNQLPFIMAAYGLGVDSKLFSPNTTTGDVTFYVSASAADAINNNICTEKKTTSSYLCYLKSISDASGNTLCGDLNLCGITIEETNVPVTFEFYKNILLDLDGNEANQQAFIMSAYGFGVDSKTFLPDTSSGAITFYVSPTAMNTIDENVCANSTKLSGYFCYLKSLKDASGNTFCEDLNPCNKSFENEPGQVVTITIYFEDAPFDFDSLYAAVARLQGGDSGSSESSTSVVSIVLDETGTQFESVTINVTLPFGSGSSPLLTAICGDSPMM